MQEGVAMFQMDSISVPVLGMIENMSYFSPQELPNNKYYIFISKEPSFSRKIRIAFIG